MNSVRARMRRAGTRMSGSRQFVVFALASLVPVAALGGVLVHSANRSAADRALAQGRSQAAVIVQMAVSPALNGRALSDGLTADERSRLRQATNLAVYSGALTALRLRDFAGRVVFSDNGSTADSLGAASGAFRQATRGHTVAALAQAPSDGSSTSIRVLLPVVPNSTGRATGVLEVYLPYAPIAAQLTHERHTTYVQLGIGLLALYLVLALISWSASRGLRRYAAQQTHQALHDPLTGLANRERFRRFAQDAIARRDGDGALVLVDLDKFKAVNDTLGHHAGDELLLCVAERLRGSVRTDDLVARLGGDEFGMVLLGASDHDEVLTLARSIHRELCAPVEVAGTRLDVRASFGISLFPQHGTELSQLLVDADRAMYRAKDRATPESSPIEIHEPVDPLAAPAPVAIGAASEHVLTVPADDALAGAVPAGDHPQEV